MKANGLEPVASSRPSVPSTEALAVRAACAASALERSIQRLLRARDQTLGQLEVQAAPDVQELLRQALQRAAQAKADATPPTCPVCGQPLSRLSCGHARSFQSRYGDITILRTRGYCKRCRQWRPPAAAALGLEESAGDSPAVQDLAALRVSKMPVEDARAVLQHLPGVELPRATLDRAAKRQGQRAQRWRAPLDRQAVRTQTQLELPLEPDQMIIQLDAWNIRARDAWGQGAAGRRRGLPPERWHWVYPGTCFRLDHRGHTNGGRPVITQRGFVLTRQGLDGWREPLHAEALRRGLGQAAGALVIADGAVWLWRRADDRWPHARQRLDFYHAGQHLAAGGRGLFGEDADQLKRWLKPLVQQLKNQSAVKGIPKLEALLAPLPEGSAATAVSREVAYLREHRERLDDRAAQRAGEPIGSGPVEATCRQAQCRFKRPGQFWSRAGDEARLGLETFWRNERWHLLFPHSSFNPARN